MAGSLSDSICTRLPRISGANIWSITRIPSISKCLWILSPHAWPPLSGLVTKHEQRIASQAKTAGSEVRGCVAAYQYLPRSGGREAHEPAACPIPCREEVSQRNGRGTAAGIKLASRRSMVLESVLQCLQRGDRKNNRCACRRDPLKETCKRLDIDIGEENIAFDVLAASKTFTWS